MTLKRHAHSLQPITLIYAGGTFGSYGSPLATLDTNIFIPLLIDVIGAKLQLKLADEINVLENSCVKDSSQLTPIDFVHFYKLILADYKNGNRQFVLLTGTDTLSYLGAFLAEAFAGSDVSIVLTASMHPLFDPTKAKDYILNEQGDAWRNLNDAISLAGFSEVGVRIAFGGEAWHAQTVQKIHSHDLLAFTGHHRAGYPANSYKPLSPVRRNHWLEDQANKLELISSLVSKAHLPALYCLPNSPDHLVLQLKTYLSLPPTGIILIGFGAGNLPYSSGLAETMDMAYKHGHMLISTSQCPYGGVSSTYAAGSWQYKHHVLSGGRLTIAAIYARLLWLHISQESPARRRSRWAYSVNQTDVVRN